MDYSTPDFKELFEPAYDADTFQCAHKIQEANKQLYIANHKLIQKKEEQDILNKKLSSLLNLKTQYFANISHELRTPLALILGPIQKLLTNKNMSTDDRITLKVAEKNAHLLLKHVNDLLDVAKHESGRLVARYEEFDAAKLFRLMAENFDSLAKERSLHYTVLAPHRLTVQCDSEKLQRIILNLLSNAFKFAPNGGSVLCQLYEQSNYMMIVVMDNGPGIPHEARERIFERFYQVESPSQRTYGGSGLGLTIVKDFVELLNGHIIVEDSPNGGAHFTVTLPLTAPENTVIDTAPTINEMSYATLMELRPVPRDRVQVHDKNKATVLVVEDNSEMNNFIASVLSHDFNIITAQHGAEGIEKACIHKPDLILSDIMMPTMSGDHMVHALRQNPELDDIPIVLLTAKADEALRLKLLREGAQDYVNKPFSHEELTARVANLIKLKKAKDDIRQQMNALSLANEELDAFNRSVSHDLRNPVAVIQGYSSILVKQADIQPRYKECLNEIQQSAKKMEHLINDLMLLSQSSKHELMLETIDLSALINTMTAALVKQHPNRQVEFCIQEGVTIQGDVRLLTIAFENLINNAWKYTCKTEKALISFGTIDAHTYFVRDNGVGFPKDKADTLFMPFTRLHAQHEFDGTGVGLTTVKRIIERHSGRVLAEGNENQGAVFYIVMP